MKSYIVALMIAVPLSCLGSGVRTIRSVQLQKRVVHGEVATTPLPFIGSLADGTGFHFCGGSLVDEVTAITAAHCFNGTTQAEAQQYRFRVGGLSIDPQSPQFGHQYRVLGFHCHEQFSIDTMVNDICLLAVQPIDTNFQGSFPPGVAPIALDTTDLEMKTDGQPQGQSQLTWWQTHNGADPTSPLDVDNANHTLWVAGWGSISYPQERIPAELHVARMLVSPAEDCLKKLESSQPPDTLVCAIGANHRADTCQGDSGGPMYILDRNGQNPLLAGLTSWGIGCGERRLSWTLNKIEIPAIYTRVYHYSEWINATRASLRSMTASSSSSSPSSSASASFVPSLLR